MQVLFKNQPVDLIGNNLKVGDKFIDFKAVDSELNEFDSQNTSGLRVFLSVPSIDTGVCEIEVNKFINHFNDLNAKCFVISLDLPFALSRWCASKNNANVVLLSDFKYHEFEKVTGTYIKQVGLLTRAVFVVDENNNVLHAEYVSEVSSEPNYDDVLKFFK